MYSLMWMLYLEQHLLVKVQYQKKMRLKWKIVSNKHQLFWIFLYVLLLILKHTELKWLKKWSKKTNERKPFHFVWMLCSRTMQRILEKKFKFFFLLTHSVIYSITCLYNSISWDKVIRLIGSWLHIKDYALSTEIPHICVFVMQQAAIEKGKVRNL